MACASRLGAVLMGARTLAGGVSSCSSSVSASGWTSAVAVACLLPALCHDSPQSLSATTPVCSAWQGNVVPDTTSYPERSPRRRSNTLLRAAAKDRADSSLLRRSVAKRSNTVPLHAIALPRQAYEQIDGHHYSLQSSVFVHHY